MWGTFLSNYKYFSCQSSCLLLLLEVCKNHYRKENISVGGSKQGRDPLFWIHLRETFLKVFILGVYEFLNIHILNWYKALYSASNSTFRHLDFIRAVRWLYAAYLGVFLKKDSYVFINTWNTEFYILLSLRQNESRYKKWHWLELGCFCKWRQSTNKEI